MKLSSYKKKREAFEHNVEDAVFTLLPMTADLITVSNIYLFNGGKEFLSPAQRIRFITECITGWSGITDDEGKEIEFSDRSKMQLAASEYDELLTDLISASFMYKNQLIESLKEDVDNAKK